MKKIYVFIISLMISLSPIFAQFGSEIEISTSVNWPNAIVCDIDGDGYNDVLASSAPDNKVMWFKNLDGLGSFMEEQVISDLVMNAGTVFSTDIDGDGDMDVLATSGLDNEVGWFENTDGLGNFSDLQIISDQAVNASFVTAKDLDMDGDMDVISASNQSNFIYWYENLDGEGNFSNPNMITDVVFNTRNVEAVDFDNDGDYDILSSGDSTNNVYVFENTNGLEDFTVLQIIQDEDDFVEHRAYSKDLDNDGDLDIIVGATEWEIYSIYWCENLDGAFDFSQQQMIHSDWGNSPYLAFSDFDDDQDIDIAFAIYGAIGYLENDNSGAEFLEPVMFNDPNQIYISSLAAADIDGDGDDDLLLGNYDKLSWLGNYFSSSSLISGHSFFDENQNGILDEGEYGFSNFQTNLSPLGIASFTNQEGEYWYAIDPNNYILSYQSLDNWMLTSDSTEYHVAVDSANSIVEGLDFGFYPEVLISDLNIDIVDAQGICGSETSFWLSYTNLGTTQPNGIIEFILEPQVTFVSADIEPDSIVGQHLYWSFDTLQYFSSDMIVVNALLPDFNSMGDTLVSIMNVYTFDESGDFTFTDTLLRELACSYDPNDKLVTPIGEGELGIVSKDETLEYTIRFQNTGNAEAINIKVRDQINENLDLESIQILASSDELKAFTEQGRWLVFQFDSIMLPDSTTNELESHGFVKFSIKIKEEVLPNALIQNTGFIYFDFNPAVITNTTVNTVECYIAPEVPVITLDEGVLSIASDHEIHWFKDGIEISDATLEELPVSENGDYMVLLIDENGCQTSSDVYSVLNIGMDVLDSLNFKLYPNPADETIIIESENIEAMHYQIYNIHSQLILEDVMQNGKSQIDVSSLSTGLYIVRLGSQSIKLTIK